MPRGRPLAVYTPKTLKTKPVVGLMRLEDGRWRASGPEKYTFTEPDECQAIAHFRSWEAKKNGLLSVKFEVPRPAPDTPVEAMPILTTIDPETGLATQHIDEHAFWARVRKEILSRPEYAAERTGIEKLGYLGEIEPPERLPTFEEMESVWKDHCRASREQRRKVIHDWNDFVTTTGITSLKQITPELVIGYRDNVFARNLSGKSQQNLFTRIRRLVSHTRSRAMAVKACGCALECLSLLTPSETTVSLDPKPITTGDWRKLLKVAKGEDRAMLLLMLNCGMYLAEAVALRWKDIKGDYLITHRAKTNRVVRVAQLWSETRQSLKAIPRTGEHLFIARHGGRLGVKGAELRWRTLRKSAGVKATSSQIRDGAATVASDAGVDAKIVGILLGHRTGISDHYIKRNPSQVKPASDAVYRAYMLPRAKM